jgi:hypothetical protein
MEKANETESDFGTLVGRAISEVSRARCELLKLTVKVLSPYRDGIMVSNIWLPATESQPPSTSVALPVRVKCQKYHLAFTKFSRITAGVLIPYPMLLSLIWAAFNAVVLSSNGGSCA